MSFVVERVRVQPVVQRSREHRYARETRRLLLLRLVPVPFSQPVGHEVDATVEYRVDDVIEEQRERLDHEQNGQVLDDQRAVRELIGGQLAVDVDEKDQRGERVEQTDEQTLMGFDRREVEDEDEEREEQGGQNHCVDVRLSTALNGQGNGQIVQRAVLVVGHFGLDADRANEPAARRARLDRLILMRRGQGNGGGVAIELGAAEQRRPNAGRTRQVSVAGRGETDDVLLVVQLEGLLRVVHVEADELTVEGIVG